MNELDRVYAQLLQVGFIVLDQAIESGIRDWVRAERTMLHNLPSLLGETNPQRHLYYWNEERDQYRQWIMNHGTKEAQSRMRTYYEPIWTELEQLIIQRFQSSVVN